MIQPKPTTGADLVRAIQAAAKALDANDTPQEETPLLLTERQYARAVKGAAAEGLTLEQFLVRSTNGLYRTARIQAKLLGL